MHEHRNRAQYYTSRKMLQRVRNDLLQVHIEET
jgi:hypothetical protein